LLLYELEERMICASLAAAVAETSHYT